MTHHLFLKSHCVQAPSVLAPARPLAVGAGPGPGASVWQQPGPEQRTLTGLHCTKLSRPRNWISPDRWSENPESLQLLWSFCHYYSLPVTVATTRHSPLPRALSVSCLPPLAAQLTPIRSLSHSHSAPALWWPSDSDTSDIVIPGPKSMLRRSTDVQIIIASPKWPRQFHPARFTHHNGLPPDHRGRHGLHALHRGPGLWPVLLAPHPDDHLILPPDESGHRNLLARVLITTQLGEEG